MHYTRCFIKRDFFVFLIICSSDGQFMRTFLLVVAEETLI